jgi:hypothetical protein
MTTESDLRDRITACLADEPSQTTDEIARRIGADYWDVQHEVCRLFMADRVCQAGTREIPGRGFRPVWRLAETTRGT